MDFTKFDLEENLTSIDIARREMGLSYQALGDACEVSQATIIRVFKRKTVPSVDLLQKMYAAVNYAPTLAKELVLPTGYTPEAYIDYANRLLVSQKEQYEQRLKEQTALYNRLRRQDRRTIFWMGLALVLLVAAFVIWLIIDVTHPTVGWIQRDVAYHSGNVLSDLFGGSGTAFL